MGTTIVPNLCCPDEEIVVEGFEVTVDTVAAVVVLLDVVLVAPVLMLVLGAPAEAGVTISFKAAAMAPGDGAFLDSSKRLESGGLRLFGESASAFASAAATAAAVTSGATGGLEDVDVVLTLAFMLSVEFLLGGVGVLRFRLVTPESITAAAEVEIEIVEEADEEVAAAVVVVETDEDDETEGIVVVDAEDVLVVLDALVVVVVGLD